VVGGGVAVVGGEAVVAVTTELGWAEGVDSLHGRDGPGYGGPLLPPGHFTFTPNVTAARDGV
jgi:hypothetical protein